MTPPRPTLTSPSTTGKNTRTMTSSRERLARLVIRREERICQRVDTVGRVALNRNQMMAQARKMQEQLIAAQEKAASTEVTSSAGGGMVKVTVTGDLRLKEIAIDPEAVDPEDVEMLQDMIVAAVNEALESADAAAQQQIGSVTNGLNIPGLF